MKKLLSIGEDQIASGLSNGKHSQKSGMWYSAPGLNPYINDPDLKGTIAESSAPTDISASVLTDTPIAAVSQASSSTTGTMYVLGDEGHLYTVDLSGDNNPVDARSATPIVNPTNGLALMKETSYQALVADASTYALYHLDGTDGSAGKLDNAEGTASRDLSEGAGNPTSVAGIIEPTADGAYNFTFAANKYLYTADDASFPTGDFTVEYFVNCAYQGNTYSQAVVSKWGAGQQTFIAGLTTDTKPYFAVWGNGAGAATEVTGTYSIGGTGGATDWHYVACVYDASSSLKIYVDGELVATNTTSIPASLNNSTSEFRISGTTDTGGGSATSFMLLPDAKVDEVRISNVARTSTDIANVGADILLYFQKNQIGKWNRSGAYPTGWDDDYIVGLTDSDYHPTHPLFDRVYFGNKNEVGYLYINGTVVDDVLDALDLPMGFTITCLNDDGANLVIGATKNLGSVDIFSETKVYFWDTNQNSWQKEWTIPSPTINAIGKIGTTLYAFCGRDIYAFNFQSSPVLVRSMSSSDLPQYGYANAIDTLGDGLIVGGTAKLNFFGKLAPEAKTAFWEPYNGVAGNVSMIFADAKADRLFVGTATPKLWRFNTSTNGYSSSELRTIYFDLKDRFRVQQLGISLPSGMASGDAMTVKLYTPTDQSTGITCSTIGYSTQGNVDYVKLVPTEAVETNRISIGITYSGGAPSIGRLELWGEPVNPQ